VSSRREFITLLGGAGGVSVGARAAASGMRRVGVLHALVADDPLSQARMS
jgi:hypothetical protein